MNLLIFFLVIAIFSFEVFFSVSCTIEESIVCKDFEPALPQTRLKLHIFCDYEPAIRPSKRNENTTVNIMLIPKTMDFDSGMNKFTLNSWLKVDWIDNHLKWNPEDFDQITELHVQSDELWVPDLTLWNSANLKSDIIFSSPASCLIAYTGLVVCIPLIKNTVHCSSDHENWPFEKQICRIIFSPNFHFNDEIFLKYLPRKILLDSFVSHQEWTIFNTTAISKTSHRIWSTIIYEFHLKRHAKIMLTLYVIPIIIFMMLTLVILWMDVNSGERIALISLNFMGHLLCLYDLQWQVSENGNRIPHLLIFYRNSLALTAYSMILTVTLRKIKAIKTSSPKWISSVESFVLRYQIGRLLILNDEEAKCFVENKNNAENNIESVQSISINKTEENIWIRFAKIIECLSFFSILLIYIFMLFTIIPT